MLIVDQVCKELGLKRSQSKTKAMYMFGTKNIGQLTIGEIAIDWVKENRYLGFLLDHSLSFVLLATEVANRMRKRLFVMQRITELTWGAAGTVLDIFYKQSLRSLFDYMSPFLAIADSRKKRFDGSHPKNRKGPVPGRQNHHEGIYDYQN
jgi:DNA phosphorothioation-dependent restriction protein DptG